MSTRGIMGFVVKGEEKITYNHSDSYPSGLGLDMLEWLRSLTGQALKQSVAQAQALRLVNEDDTPTAGQIEQLRQFTNTGVGSQSDEDWYCLLRECQGDPAATLAAGYMNDGHEFAQDSLFCEWGYVVDFDRCTFEVYRGFQTSPPTAGRFVGLPGDDKYFPIQLVAEWSLERLPTPDEFVAAVDKDEAA